MRELFSLEVVAVLRAEERHDRRAENRPELGPVELVLDSVLAADFAPRLVERRGADTLILAVVVGEVDVLTADEIDPPLIVGAEARTRRDDEDGVASGEGFLEVSRGEELLRFPATRQGGFRSLFWGVSGAAEDRRCSENGQFH
jgi:hypothetical protein